MSLPGAVSPIGGKVQVVEIPHLAKSRGPKSNALAYAECHCQLRVRKHKPCNIGC